MYAPILAGQKWRASERDIGMVDEVVRTSTSGTFTAETVLDYATFTAVAGARYWLMCAIPLQSSVANDIVDLRFRWEAAASLTTGGTEFHHISPTMYVANRGQIELTFRSVTGLTAGQVSIGVTAARNSGTGNISSVGSSNQNSVLWLLRD